MRDYYDRIEIELEDWEYDMMRPEIEAERYVAEVNERMLAQTIVQKYTRRVR